MTWADYLRVSSFVHEITEGIWRSSDAVVAVVDAIGTKIASSQTHLSACEEEMTRGK